MDVVAVQQFNEANTKKRPTSASARWDKRQRLSVEEEELESAHTAFRLHQAKVGSTLVRTDDKVSDVSVCTYRHHRCMARNTQA